MIAHRLILASLMAMLLSACTLLTAEQPLFTTADQTGQAPLREGVWIMVSENCAARYAQRRSGRFPASCNPMDIRRDADGAWRASPRIDLMSGPPDDDTPKGPMRVVIAPAIEQASAGFARLYVGQYATDAARTLVNFVVIAPIGEMPASTFAIAVIDCTAILREGPIEGIEIIYRSAEGEAPPVEGDAPSEHHEDATPVIQSCIATTQAGVREAARRTLIEEFSNFASSGERFVFVREN